MAVFALERLIFQGSERCPQYRWTQYALCAKREPLDRIAAAQKHPEEWRVTQLACTQIVLGTLRKIA